MTNYIDAEKLIAEIERLNSFVSYERKDRHDEGLHDAYKAVKNIIYSLQQEQLNTPKGKFNFPKFLYVRTLDNKTIDMSYAPQNMEAIEYVRNDFIEQEQLEIDLKKFTEKMDDLKARFNRPDNIPIKATMAFTARMFYQYPNVARLWYEQLPKATMD